MDDAGFDAPGLVRQIVRSAATASLGTLTAEGAPFVSFVTVATDTDGSPLILISSLAAHTRNLARDERGSLLLQAPADETSDPLTGARVTLVGRFRRIAREESGAQRLFTRFLARHPKAEGYASFGDFALYHMSLETIHLVAGFGRIARLSAEEFLVLEQVAEAFISAEPALLGNLNGAAARILAVDPDGVDVSGDGVRRLAFLRRAESPSEVKSLLSEIA